MGLILFFFIWEDTKQVFLIKVKNKSNLHIRILYFKFENLANSGNSLIKVNRTYKIKNG